MENRTAILSFGALSGEASDDVKLADFPLEEQIIVSYAQQPWGSVSNIARRLNASMSDIYKACAKLEEEKMIAGRDLGVSHRSQRRYVLSRRGVMHVTTPFQYKGLVRAALPLTWQMSEEGARKMLGWLPMIECLYEVLPTFWTCGLAAPFQWQSPYPDPSSSSYVWLGRPTLMGVLWLPRGRLHAVTSWRFDRDYRQPVYLSIPVLWSGLLPQEDYRSRSLRLGSEFIRCARDPEDQILWDIEPQVAAIGTDEFAAFRARTAYGDDVQMGSVGTAGALVWSAEASHSKWNVADEPPKARSVGHPEAATIEEGPDLVNLGGIREYRVLCFVTAFRAGTKANLATAFRMSRKSVNTVVDRLTELGLITSVGKNLYGTRRSVEMLAARDRVDARRLVEVTYLDPNGDEANRERRHDEAVAAAAAKFLEKGIPAVAGWRWVVSWDNGQLVPDLWIQLPVPGRERGIWVAVELEFSAKTPRRIKAEKLRSFRLAPVRLGKTFPVLVITGEALAAQHFDDLAGNLPLLATTLKEFLTGIWEGPESVWRRGGRPVGLSDIATENEAHLRQPTGRSSDNTQPSGEVWARLGAEESIWSDPYAELGGMGLPYIHINPPPRTNLAKGKAEQPETKPASALVPPPAAPAPVRVAPTAEERARQRRKMLIGINYLVAVADGIVADRLRLGDVSDADRLCLRRVEAVITYGNFLHHIGDGEIAEKLRQRCLELRDEHIHTVRSGKPFWWLSSPTKTDPSAAFKDTLEKRPKHRQDACRIFNDWLKLVERASRPSR